MQEQASTERLLKEYELLLLQPAARTSDVVSRLLAETFVEFGSSGRVFNKAQTVSALQAESPVQVLASDFKVQVLAPHLALVTYSAVRQSEPPKHTLHSSIWQQNSGRWQMVFHQGTIAETTR